MACLVFASPSSDQLGLLRRVGVSGVRVCSSDVGETPQKKELPSQYAVRIAREKATQISGNNAGEFILAAHAVVALGRRIFCAPETSESACQLLQLLSGRRHRVYVGICVILPNGRAHTRLSCIRVAFKKLSPPEIAAFLESGEWKGGYGYRIDGVASTLISWINGEPSAMMGLPLYEVAQLLQGNGFPLWMAA